MESLQQKKSAALLKHFVQNFKLRRTLKYSRDPAKVMSILRNGNEDDPNVQKSLKDWKFLKCFPDKSQEDQFKMLLRILKFKHFKSALIEEI